MEERNDAGRSYDRPMYDVNQPCASCGTTVEKLPFQPRPGSDVYCTECYRNRPRPQRDFRR